MNNKNYEIYKNIMSDNPDIDKDYLSCILDLSENQTINFVGVTEVTESNTALVIKVTVQIKDVSDNIYARKLFIKTVKRNKNENVYHGMSMNEGKFYKFIKDNAINNLPVPVCYDVFLSEEKGEFLIVLEDISDYYTSPDSVKLSDKDTWFSCAESLAKFHAAFWNHKIIPKFEIELDHDSPRKDMLSFINEFIDKFDGKTKDVLIKAIELNISFMKKFPYRINSKNNVTICNGDSHIYNFMLPLDKRNKPLMVDFQFWGEGVGTGDLAHLTRVNFSDDLKKDIQISLVERYYKTLLENGVTGYSWEDCLTDYRVSAATMVLIPFYQYNGFNIKYEDWIGDLQGLVYNYEYLNCDELYIN